MTRELVVITDSFPWGTRTDFLEDEIHVLASAFDSVILAPMQPQGGRAGLPANVDVDLGLAASASRSRRARAGMARPAQAVMWRELRSRRVPRSAAALMRTFLRIGDLERVRRWAAGRSAPAAGYTYWLGPQTAGLRAAWPTTPIVSRAHGGDLYLERYDPPYLPVHRRAVAACDLLAVVSERGAEYVRALYPDLADRVTVARLGTVADDRICPSSADGTVRIVTCSSLTNVKRPVRLAQGVCRFARDRPRVSWVHLGDGPRRTDVEAWLAANCPPTLDADLPGFVPYAEVIEKLANGPIDVFLNVSELEGAPVSLMEAQSYGIPVVATAVGGTPEVVDGTLNVLLPPDPTADEVATAVGAALELPAAYRERRKERWRARYDARSNYAEFARRLQAIAVERAG